MNLIKKSSMRIRLDIKAVFWMLWKPPMSSFLLQFNNQTIKQKQAANEWDIKKEIKAQLTKTRHYLFSIFISLFISFL